MKREKLLEDLAKLGYPLLGLETKPDINIVITELVRSRDMRLWEGFPIVLANCLADERFNLKEIGSKLKNVDKSILKRLLFISLALYKVVNYESSLYSKIVKTDKDKNTFDVLMDKIKHNKGTIDVAKKTLLPDRLKKFFLNYMEKSTKKIVDFVSQRNKFNLEYYLSQIFSPKQKELFLKKLKRENLSKTEKEYFSRAVKKKVSALADPELHRLAQRLLK